ncbi:geranylgeranyl reductase family protein [Synechococcus sp. HJ21-Hayes]|uniref:NAD(P)/FAD-dependent oxidoreductase n=1 Tax=unclassified Synechococcus TaxID=2626047 RepID=UPI0020CB87D1|nr:MULTISPECIES: geranylgeranyl reductase family protein [unclassified Synechococcus]MCP9830228.1 geranylgeranyl reductase family protein [Synechococcus sp. JJ3a-Johnson]MCP9851793.1 geranylgeranyl reductase family protein [Synechococcus sp. HJ21-Hayes]
MSSTAGLSADVIVVGAGAAGAAAAFHLAARGRRVLLLEAQAMPRPKPCGGGMAASVQRWFPFDLIPAVDQVIEQVRFTWCLEDAVTAVLPGDSPFWIVRRSRLDAYLTDQAVAAGAELEDGSAVETIERDGLHWRVVSGGTVYSSRGLVLADGSNSRFSVPLGLGPARPRFAAAVSVEVEAEVHEPSTARFEFGLVRHGFCWAFPRQGGYSIGVGTFIGREAADADAVLAQVLPSLGLSPQAGERCLSPLRVWDRHHPLHVPGAVVVGDAASLCDPFLAEGLRPALLSGVRAAEAMDHFLSGEDAALQGYSATMRAEWGESMAWGRRIAQVFYRLPKVGYQLGIKRPTAPQRIAQILSGEMGYGDIAQRVIKRLMFQRG